MLMKADGPRELARCLAQWRALLPYWNAEADRMAQQVGAGSDSAALLESLQTSREIPQRCRAGRVGPRPMSSRLWLAEHAPRQ